jgi:M6 family metalloprotease-like protein
MLLINSSAIAEVLPAPGLYDPVTMRSTTTGDPYPVFPEDANRIPPMNPDRVDEVDQALTIVIHAQDVPNTHVPASFDSLLYSTGIYPSGSLNDYFLESSYGNFGLDGDVYGWVVAENDYSYYTSGGNYGMGWYPNNAQRLVEEAIAGADALGADFSIYDNDGDGWVDALIIVHQGPGAENTGSVDDIWSHRWAISDPIELDGVWVYDYCIDPELSGIGITGEIEHIGVFGHEYTHLLGLPDLYDYDEKLNPATFTVLGDDNDHPVMDWGIMGYGGYGISSYGRGAAPSHHAGYFKTLLGWADPIFLNSSENNIQVPEVEINPTIYKIPIGGSGTEYFLVENRNPGCAEAIFDKWDSDFSAWFNWFTPGSNPLDAGLVIYHIDEEMPLNDGWPDDPHYGCCVVDAGYNASQPWPSLEFTEWWYPYEFRVGAAWSAEDFQDEFTPLTDPSTDGYYGPSGIHITNISNSGSLMTFDLTFTGDPMFGYAGSAVQNDSGDDDGFLDMNETGDLYILLRNTGYGEATQVSGTLTTLDPYITIEQGQANYPDLGITGTGENLTPFQLSVSGDCPIGYDAEAILEVTWDGGSDQIAVPLELNWDLVFADDVESGPGDWTHDVAFGTSYNDQWHISTARNHTSGGENSWKCGSEGGGNYANRLNAELVSPPITLHGDARVSFWHRLNAEETWDGGVIEREVLPDIWEQIVPIGGYPDMIEHYSSSSPFPYGTLCYSSDFDWTLARVIIPGASGDESIRFRFGSDGGVAEEGWYIDDFRFYEGEGLSSVGDEVAGQVPCKFALKAPYPNPFNASTVLQYTLPKNGHVTLEIVDVQGRKVTTLVDGNRSAGMHTASLSGQFLPSGVYFAVLKASNQTAVQKILHIK